MHAIVLYHGSCEPIRSVAKAVAEELGVRAIAFDRRPDLAMYDLVVLAVPAAGVLDPRLAGFAGLELRGKTFAIVSDAGPLGEPLFWGLGAAAMLGGARIFAPQLHLATGWLSDSEAIALRQAHEWGRLLAAAFPTPTFPRGPAGKRTIR